MRYLNLKSFVVSIILGIISLLLFYNDFHIYLLDSHKTIEVIDIFVLIGTAITGPFGAIVISVISNSYKILYEQNYFTTLVQLFSLILFSLTYKRYISNKLSLPIFLINWGILVFFYYFIFPLPIILIWYLINPIFLEIQTNQQNILQIIKVLYTSVDYQFLFTLIFSTLMISSLPEQIKKTLWTNEAKTKSEQSLEIKNKFVRKNLFVIRLFMWFLVITVVPFIVIVNSIIREYSFQSLKQEAIVGKNLAESLKLKLKDMDKEQVRQFLEGVKLSLDGDFFILSTSGDYLFNKDSLKVNKSSLTDYSNAIISKILSEDTGYIVDKNNNLAIGYSTLKGVRHIFKIVYVSDPQQVIILRSNLFKNLRIVFGIGAIIISSLFISILWLLIRNPINKITKVVEKINEGNYNVRINDAELLDDIKIFARTFNIMADKIIAVEKRYEEFLNLLPLSVAEVDITGKLLYVNSKGYEVFGYSPEDLSHNLTVLDFIDEKDRERALDNISKAKSKTDFTPSEYLGVKKDGTKFPILIYSSIIVKEGIPTGLRSIIVDLSEKKEAEEKLYESIKKLDLIANTINVGFWEYDYETKKIFRSEQWAEMLAYKPEEIIPTREFWLNSVHPDERQEVENSVQNIDNGLINSYQIIHRLRCKNGDYKWILNYGKITVKNENGTPKKCSGIHVDIDEKIRIEEKLKTTEAKFTAIIGGLTDIVCLINSENKLDYVTPSFNKKFGFQIEDVIGKSFFEFIHSDDLEFVTKELSESLNNKSIGIPIVFRIRTKKNEYLYIEGVFTNLIENILVNSIVLFGRDITERIITQKKLQESEQRLGHLLFNIQDPIVLLSFDGFIKFANPASYKLVQIDESTNLLGVSFTKFMKQEEIEKAFMEINQIFENSGPQNAIYEIFTSKGEKRWVDVTGVKTTFDNEDVLLLTIKDVTEIKNAQNILEISEKRFKSVWENTLDAMRITDETGTIIEVNQAYCDLVKKNREELVGLNLSVVSFENFQKQVQENYIYNFKENLLKPKYDASLELWNGEIIYVEVAHNFLTIENESKLLLTVFHNISDKVAAEKSLIENEERFRITVEQTEQIFYDLDISTGKIIWNGAIEKLTGYNNKEFNEIDLNKWKKLIHPEDKEKALTLLEKAIKEIGNYLCEYRFSKKDGSYIIVEDRAVVLSDQTGQSSRMIGTIKDITERKIALSIEQEKTKRIAAQTTTLIEISTNSSIINDDFQSAIKFITEKVSKTLNVERVSVWLFESNDTILSCKNLYILSENKYYEGLSLKIEKYPNYFTALKNNLAIDANDALNDKRTKEYKEDYLIPYNIKSMLDIGIRESGKTIGVICVEQVCEKRKWEEDEISFVRHIAEQISILYSNYKKRIIEEELEKSERQYQTLIENLNEAIILVDNDDRILFVNEKFTQLLGYSLQEIKGKVGYEILLDPAHKHKIIEAKLERLKGRGGQYEARFIKKNGEYIDFLINGSPVFDNYGNVIGSLGAMTDITERKKTEELIRIKSENFKRIFDLAPFGLLIASFESKAIILNVNKAYCEIIEKKANDLIGKESTFFIEDTVAAELSSIFYRDGIIRNYEYSFKAPSGKQKIVLISSFYIEYDNKLCTLNVIEDITEKKQIELELEKHRLNLEKLVQDRTQELEKVNAQLQEEIVKQKEAEEKVRKALEKEKELNELKTKFISIASHEFRTPLATMLSSTDLIELFHKNNSEEKFQLQLQRIRNNINHLTNIIDDILVISRAESNKLNCEKVFINLDDFLKDIIEDTKMLLSPNHHLYFNNLIEFEQIFIDPKLFRIVLMNIISNAIKYSPLGGTIGFEVVKQEKNIVFKVSDQGIGIPEKDLKNIFEPFHRSDNVGSIRGTGLGLVIVKKYVELHNGSIKIESKEGEGTTIFISIPDEE